MIGQRIKQARKVAGLSLHGLGEKVGMSAMMVSKYEKNQSTPSSTALLALAEALGVRTEYFFRQMSVELENINHREHHLLPDSEERKVLADIKEQLERWLALEDVLTPLSMPFALSQDFPKRIASWDDIEELAILVRQDWNLGLNPIPDLIDTLETLFSQLVYRALSEELLSESKAAELLNISVMEFHECRTLQAQGGEQHGTAGLRCQYH